MKKFASTQSINAVLYEEDGVWVAQGIEYDITAQADAMDAVIDRFAFSLSCEIAISLDLGKEPLGHVGPAPDIYWDMYAKAKASVVTEPLPARVDNITPFLPTIYKYSSKKTATAA